MNIGKMLRAKRRAKDESASERAVLIVGNPNVGKSLLFHRLTGRYVTVSNYPGTTVEISKGVMRHRGQTYRIIDTPGMYSLNPITDEERVARNMLLKSKDALVLHIVDAKCLDRMLPLTGELIEANLPIVLIVNMVDELEKRNQRIDQAALQSRLRIPVVCAACLQNRGVSEIRQEIHGFFNR